MLSIVEGKKLVVEFRKGGTLKDNRPQAGLYPPGGRKRFQIDRRGLGNTNPVLPSHLLMIRRKQSRGSTSLRS